MELDVRNGYQGDTPLGNYPDFSQQGYQVIQELGRNREAGRTTYLAYELKTDQRVVIKEFRFASVIPDWSGLKAYEREIKILQQLNHSRIPRYVDSFETSTGFYMLQEYKNAPSLGLQRSFHPEEIQQIAVSVLEILVYLQKRIAPIIHRDIKPENVLVDDLLNAYLIDFGLAKTLGAKMSLSSFAVGTPGFMPPEEQFGYPLTEASDLYSLGATLICLLTRTRSVDISQLIDAKHRFNFQKLVPQISPDFRSWLMKMVAHKRQHRYANAAVALAALKPISVIGNATDLQTLVASVKSRKQTFVLSLAAIGTLAVAGTQLMSAQSAVINKQVLEARECQNLNSTFSCLNKPR
ncbi:MAG: serine/threonine protein kinase [Aulosira sp. ZfuVER01]|nr:serine/threonine-protein kinase [Aulosira sp. ZfuVER01]MDZ7997869.1 serine/threonine-protein kinase [Aulosira sp. DedVER01a]MDZ8055994.1 serine/threonine-protein kinase [Aulosira sp. ZfuCHP01]